MRPAHGTSLARDGTQAPALEVWSLNPWTAGLLYFIFLGRAASIRQNILPLAKVFSSGRTLVQLH